MILGIEEIVITIINQPQKKPYLKPVILCSVIFMILLYFVFIKFTLFSFILFFVILFSILFIVDFFIDKNINVIEPIGKLILQREQIILNFEREQITANYSHKEIVSLFYEDGLLEFEPGNKHPMAKSYDLCLRLVDGNQIFFSIKGRSETYIPRTGNSFIDISEELRNNYYNYRKILRNVK